MNLKALLFYSLIVLLFTDKLLAQDDDSYRIQFQGNKSADGGSAYSGMQASLNGILVLPLGSFSTGTTNSISNGIGANANLKYLFEGRFALGAYAGFNLLNSRAVGQTSTLLQYGAMAEYYLSPGSSPYLGFEIGNYSYAVNGSASSNGIAAYSFSKSNLGIGPNLGYIYYFNPNIAANFNLKYNHVFQSITNNISTPTQFMQISAGLVFNLRYRQQQPSTSDE